MSYVLKGTGDITSQQSAILNEQHGGINKVGGAGAGQSGVRSSGAGAAVSSVLKEIPILGKLFANMAPGQAASGGSGFPLVPVALGGAALLYFMSRRKGKKGKR